MKISLLSASILLLLSALASPARAELTPDQVIIIAMAQSEPSRELAEYYAKARGIPESHIFLMEGRPEQRITRYQWEETYRPAILKWLKQQEFFSNIRCLTTMWDVPLEISPVSSTAPEITERVAHLHELRVALVRQAATLVRMLYAASGQPEAAGAAGTIADDISTQDLYDQFVAAMRPTQAWLRSTKSQSERLKAGQFVDRVLVTVSGNQGLLRLASPRNKSVTLTPEQKSRLAYLLGRAEGYQRGMKSLNLLRATIARDQQAIEMAQAMGGLFGGIRWIEQQLHLLEKNYTTASFDSELSLILWPDPPVLSWVPNPWHYRFDAGSGARQTTLFVARLSAPAPQIVRRMIDNMITTEKSSLQGTVYLDARALARDPGKRGDVFSQYDQSLRDLAERLRNHSALKVVFDNKPEVFQPEQCPNAALYCGWHSRGQYVDAFRWTPGAVGYHLSSLEASWLQLNDDNRVQHRSPWCPAMLADGASATIGSCRESDLAGFPLPDDFFSLLLTGKYSLAEVYYRTCPFVSWTMLLVGDPLYNPYKSNPKLSEANLPERMNPAATHQAAAANPADEPPVEPSADVLPKDIGPSQDAPTETDQPEPPEFVLPGLDS